MRTFLMGAAMFLVGCVEEAADAPEEMEARDLLNEEASIAPPQEGCVETHYVDMDVVGVVLGPDGEPIADAVVWLEERTWQPDTVHGEGVTDAEGRFAFEAVLVPIAEGCSIDEPTFFAVAEAAPGVGEVTADIEVAGAWFDGTMVADLSDADLVLR